MQLTSSLNNHNVDSLTRAGIAALKAGDHARARELLIEATVVDPQHEKAWLWLSGAVTSDTERLHCLRNVLAINPNNESAHRGLALLLRPPVTPSVAPIEPEPAPVSVQAQPSLPLPAASAIQTTGITPEAQAAIDYVLDQLGAHVERNAVIRALAERLCCSWAEAEQIVVYVETERRTSLAARQTPLLIWLGLVTLLVGSAFVLRSGLFMLREIHTLGLPDPQSIGTFATGLAMICGSVMGLWQTIRALW